MEAYSAGLMSQSFWFIEFKKVVKLISDGKSQNEIKSACIEENLFGAVNAYRSKRIAGYLTNRAAALDAKEVQLFMESDPATQKLLNLIAILRTDRLFFNKEVQSAEVEAWKDTTKRKLRSCYFNFMVDANLLAPDGKTRRITPPILDIALERHLEAKGDSAIIKAITGVS